MATGKLKEVKQTLDDNPNDALLLIKTGIGDSIDRMTKVQHRLAKKAIGG